MESLQPSAFEAVAAPGARADGFGPMALFHFDRHPGLRIRARIVLIKLADPSTIQAMMDRTRFKPFLRGGVEQDAFPVEMPAAATAALPCCTARICPIGIATGSKNT